MKPEYLDYHIELGGAGLILDPEKEQQFKKEGGAKEPFSVLEDSDSFEEVRDCDEESELLR